MVKKPRDGQNADERQPAGKQRIGGVEIGGTGAERDVRRGQGKQTRIKRINHDTGVGRRRVETGVAEHHDKGRHDGQLQRVADRLSPEHPHAALDQQEASDGQAVTRKDG